MREVNAGLLSKSESLAGRNAKPHGRYLSAVSDPCQKTVSTVIALFVHREYYT